MEKFSPKTALIISWASVPNFMLPTVQSKADPRMWHKWENHFSASTFHPCTYYKTHRSSSSRTYYSVGCQCLFYSTESEGHKYPSVTNRGGGLWHNCPSCSFRNQHCTNGKNEKIQQQLQFLKLFPVLACSLLTDEETADGHSKTGSQTKLLWQKSSCRNSFTPWTATPGSGLKCWLEDLIAGWCEAMRQLMSSGWRSSNQLRAIFVGIPTELTPQLQKTCCVTTLFFHYHRQISQTQLL